MNIYVGNLARSISEDTLQSVFEQFGKVLSTKIITDKFSGESRGFAFVKMASKEEGQKAIQDLNGHELEGRTITVNEARPRESRPPRQNNRY